MAKKLEIQGNFTAGELSPRLYAHTDVNKYGNGLKTAQNVSILPQGPVRRRNGSKYIAEVKNSANPVRLLRFQFDQSNAYILELSNTYIRFYKNGGQITSLGTPVEIAAPWLSAELFEITYVQFGTTIYFAHYNHPPQKLVWTNDSTWTLSEISFFPPATSEDGYAPSATLTPAAVTGLNINFTASVGVFLAADVGREILTIDSNGNYTGKGRASITALTSSTVVVCDILDDFASTSAIASGSWKMDLSPVASLETDGTGLGATINVYGVNPSQSGVFSPNTDITPAVTTGSSIKFTADDAIWSSSNVGQVIANLKGGGRAKINAVPSSFGITAITKAAPAVITAASALPYTNGDRIKITGVGGPQQFNNAILIIYNLSGATFSVTDINNNPIDSSGWAAYTSGGTITPCFVTADITSDFPSIAKIPSSNWQLETPIDVFRAADVGNYLLINNGVALVQSVVSANQITATVQKDLDATSATQAWSLEYPAWTAIHGYPRVVALYQQRLVFASTALKPQSIWMSETGVFTSMGVGSKDADGISVDVATQQINQVNWSISLRGDFLLGTTSSELSLDGGSASATITPSTIVQLSRSFYGSQIQQSFTIASEAIYFQKSARKIMAMHYDFLVDNYVSEDLTFLAEHITAGLIKELAYAQDPDRNIFAVCQDGSMVVGTYYKEQQVIAWTKWVTDGLYESVQTISTGQYDEVWVVVNRTINGSTARYVERFDTTDGSSNIDGYSDCYLYYSQPIAISGITKANPGVVTATAHGLSNGNTIKMLNVGGMTDVIGKTYTVASVTTNTFALHDSLGNNIDTSSFDTYTSGGSAYKLVSTISGLSYLEGKTVEVKQDGGEAASAVVSSGSITLETPAYEVTVGLPYTSIVHTMSKEYNLGIGSQQGQQVRWVRPILRLYKSAFPTLNGAYKPSRAPTDHMDFKLGLFSGDVVYGGLSWDATGELEIELTGPFPMVLLGIFGSLEGGSQ